MYSIKKQGLTHCQMVVPRRHLHNFGAWAVSGAARSRQQWTDEHHRQAKTPEKSKIKRVLSYVR